MLNQPISLHSVSQYRSLLTLNPASSPVNPVIMADDTEEIPSELLTLAQALLVASKSGSLQNVKDLLAQGAPTWYQDEDLGWSCLHYAAERRMPELLETLLEGGAVWNAMDSWGRTAGEICLSLGDRAGWEVIRNDGIRSEMLAHFLGGTSSSSSATHLKLRANDQSSAGNNEVFLKSKLTWDLGEDGKERVLDADGNGVMMGWEEPLMKQHVALMIAGRPDTVGLAVLNIGFGLGIIDRIIQSESPRLHIIVEAHSDVLAHMKATGVYDWPNVKVLEGRWQDHLIGKNLKRVLELSADGFDAIFMDTFAEGYEDLKTFFESVVPDILEPQQGVFSFWNGLGATNATIHAVSSSLAELHMEDVGLHVQWQDVPIAESQREEVWKGVRRRYWDLPGYKLPIAKMCMH
ncbi:S-adenosyl-L-methionine-dependent methyltransferase [Kockovaella imperatae]|uniref:Arginine N-methyltransferase 2 n=1 Tax=Kockovaella imperatae TaxID=4999 RepID=A0A1Y1UTC8_9TREE|nr:S-adenosyl-L-methionine-dependent methyltransferase [Kockovaella imperatae]ORX41283.1 S-adenosyl-L-methionine-dependent methyltransferase [Kockovaella imperatae]